MVLRQGLANSVGQSRQFIVHGHIAVAGKKIASPSYLVPVEEEKKIAYYGKKMQLNPKVIEAKKDIKKEFEEAKPEAGEEKAKAAASAPKEKEAKEEKAVAAKEAGKKAAPKEEGDSGKKKKKPSAEKPKEKGEKKEEVKKSGE